MGNAPVRVGLAAAALALAVALGAGCAGNPENRRNAGEFTDDAALTAKVKSAIATDVGARAAAAVNVDTRRGTVQLTGSADSEDTSRRAAGAAQKVGGVRGVRNDIRLKSAS
jgi:hyperosmotically inducible periplasmic protein